MTYRAPPDSHHGPAWLFGPGSAEAKAATTEAQLQLREAESRGHADLSACRDKLERVVRTDLGASDRALSQR